MVTAADDAARELAESRRIDAVRKIRHGDGRNQL